MNTTYSSFREQFINKHGGMDLTMPIGNGWFLFPDGAEMEGSAYGVTIEPPSNPVKQWRKIVDYWERSVTLAEENFVTLKRRILATFDESARKGFCGFLYRGSQDDAVRDLNAAKASVTERRRRLSHARLELKRLISPESTQLDRTQREQQAAAVAAHQASQQQFHSAVNSINV